MGESARILFTEGVMALLTALSEEQPVVLVVDDVHLADGTSQAVLHLILRRVRALPFMVLLSSSTALESETPNARKFVDNADSIGRAHLGPGPLAESDATTLLASMLANGNEAGPTITRAILGAACGNPMVMELLVNDWAVGQFEL